MKKSNKGVTLVELVIVLSLLTFGIGIAVNMILFSRNAQAKTLEEFDFQSEMRQSSQIINNEIRNSTVVFAVPQNTFNNKKAMWNYLGLKDSKTLVQYTWNESANDHDEKILYKSDKDISLNLMFKKKNLDSKLIEFTLQGYIDGKSDPKMTIKSELEAFNSLVVEDGGTPSYPATALAYRTDDTPGPTTKAGKKVVAAVTLVLDKSGSMNDAMDGNKAGAYNGRWENELVWKTRWEWSWSEWKWVEVEYQDWEWVWKEDWRDARIDIMKDKANKLVNQFENNVYVSIISYSNSANGTHTFRNAKDEITSLQSDISKLQANGGTNIGDGMRKGFYALKKISQNPKQIDSSLPSNTEVIPYLIVLTDGEPTYYSGISTSDNGSYRIADGDVDNSYIHGPGDKYNDNTTGYVKKIADDLIKGGGLNIRTYAIGFTAVPSEITKAKNIAIHTNGKYYEANSDVQLEEIFDEIGGTILKEMWHIYGPYAEDENNN